MSRRGYGAPFRGGGSRGGWGSDQRSSRGSSRGMSEYSSRGGRGGYPSRGPERSVGGRYWSGGGPGENSFDSPRSRYPPSQDPRYSSSSRHEESFKRPYRSETSYGGRDIGGHRSPERKRIRSEIQGDRSPRALNSRRSHEGGYPDYGANGGHRYETSGRYSSERRFPPPERRSSGSFRPPPSSPRHEEYRKPRPAPRGSFRGRISTRGIARREVIRGRRILETRSRMSGRSSEYLRKLRLAKMRSAATRRLISSRKFRSTRPAVRREPRIKKEKKSGDEEDEDEDADKKTDKGTSDNEADDTKSSNKLNGASSPIGDLEDDAGDEKKEGDKTEIKKEDSSDNEPRSRYTGRRFIRLTCVHCHDRCVTFKEYVSHLQRSKHLAAMRRVAIKQKSVLSRMRVLQRSKQRDLDKDDENQSSRKNFCLLCKLNYKQLKSVHQSSEAHKEMKRFLMPFCKVCCITFRSPMLYENHVCSLDHIKRKAKMDSDDKARDVAGSGNEGELNLENFLTLDSVGNIDEDDLNDSDKKSQDGDLEGDDVKADELRAKSDINVGQEHVRKIEVLYCDLCRTYLTSAIHATSEKKRASALTLHCRTRSHLKRYVRKTEDAALRETAERIHRKNQAKTDSKDGKDLKEHAEEEKDGSDALEASKLSVEVDSVDKPKEKSVEDGAVSDEKMWADVDKDLGDLLAVVEEPGNKSSDEDEGNERYDRLKTKEKIDSKVEGKIDDENKVEKEKVAEDVKVEDTK